MIMACTSGLKHENLHIGAFEYAELKNGGNQKKISKWPPKIQDGRQKKWVFLIIVQTVNIFE